MGTAAAGPVRPAEHPGRRRRSGRALGARARPPGRARGRARFRDAPRSGRAGRWMAAEYCSTSARGALADAGARHGPRHADQGGADRRSSAPPDCGALRGRRAPDRAASASGSSGCSVGVRRSRPSWERRALRRLERRGLVRLELQPQRRRPAHSAVGAGLGLAPALTAEQRAALREMMTALDSAQAGPISAPRGDRFGQDRGLPAAPSRRPSRPGATRSCSCLRSALTPQALAGSRRASARWWRCCTRLSERVSATTSGSALRRGRGAGVRRAALGGVRAAA